MLEWAEYNAIGANTIYRSITDTINKNVLHQNQKLEADRISVTILNIILKNF